MSRSLEGPYILQQPVIAEREPLQAQRAQGGRAQSGSEAADTSSWAPESV